MVIFRSYVDNLLGDMGYVVPHPKFGGIVPPVPPLDYARDCLLLLQIIILLQTVQFISIILEKKKICISLL